MENQKEDRRPELPSGWVPATDLQSGQTYYVNATTGTSSWNVPISEYHNEKNYNVDQRNHTAGTTDYTAYRSQQRSEQPRLPLTGRDCHGETLVEDATRIADPVKYELSLVSAGQISDACFMLQHPEPEGVATVGYVPYGTPIAVRELPPRPGQETGRLHTRYYALREQIKPYCNAASSGE